MTGFLRGGGTVFEEGADSDVEMVSTASLVGNFEKRKIVVHCFVGIGEQYNTMILEGF